MPDAFNIELALYIVSQEMVNSQGFTALPGDKNGHLFAGKVW